MSLSVGTIVCLNVAMLKNKPGVLGFVFNDYGEGSQVIFENGMYDGFSNDEQNMYLKVIGETNIPYKFTNVVQLYKDFEDGYFDKAFDDHRLFCRDLRRGNTDDTEEQTKMGDDELRHVFIEIYHGKGNHGSFVMAFSDALLRADSGNFQLLKPVALELIRKYGL